MKSNAMQRERERTKERKKESAEVDGQQRCRIHSTVIRFVLRASTREHFHIQNRQRRQTHCNFHIHFRNHSPSPRSYAFDAFYSFCERLCVIEVNRFTCNILLISAFVWCAPTGYNVCVCVCASVRAKDALNQVMNLSVARFISFVCFCANVYSLYPQTILYRKKKKNEQNRIAMPYFSFALMVQP